MNDDGRSGVGGSGGGDEPGFVEGDFDDDGLDWFDAMLVELKSRGLSDTGTALQLGCSTKKIQRHKKRPAVKAALAARTAERVSQVRALLGEAAVEAVAVLYDGLRAPRPADRLRAAQIIVNSLFRLRGDDGNTALVEEVTEELEDLRRLHAPTQEGDS